MKNITKIDFKKYLKLYLESSGLYPEKLKEIGKKYHKSGYMTRDDLYDLAHLNSTRSSYHVKKNPKSRVKEVTKIAYSIDHDFSQIALYNSLKGIGTPTASAILTSLDDEKHCVIDTRVWATLYNMGFFEKEKESFEPNDYIKIIKIVRDLAKDIDLTVSQIGYALFSYDKIHREGTLH
ncbi:MAG: hypothetical protein ACOCP4_00240 [Candidatus Woesearchaeota archaeon]